MRGSLVMRYVCGLAALLTPLTSQAQSPQTQKPAPVEERSPGAAPELLLQQQRATAAYRDMQQAVFEARLAEQDALLTQDAYTATRARADTLQAELDKSIKARDAAKAKEAAARKRYDEALQTDVR